ncbi:TetR/AcrR family transcriptional regulator [Dongia sp.]|uniref:TetR/AcrR family transcriptional regulator n=1 Tax=Dongia sp. TaxID=1977262 RepID=UPI003750E127
MEERILDAAECIFADNGFSETTTRMIAEASGANQALIRYYFGTKEKLFEKVFKRRGMEISGRRHVLLDELEMAPTAPTARQIIEAYLQPQWELKKKGAKNGGAFVKLQARLHNEPIEAAFKLRREVYDLPVRRYIAALQRALPNVDPTEVAWRMVFLIGTYLYMLSDVHRFSDITNIRLPKDDKVVLDHLVRFLEAGMAAPGIPDGRTKGPSTRR